MPLLAPSEQEKDHLGESFFFLLLAVVGKGLLHGLVFDFCHGPILISLVEGFFPGLEGIEEDLAVVVSREGGTLSDRLEPSPPMGPCQLQLAMVALIYKLINSVFLADCDMTVIKYGLEASSCSNNDI